jgi:hypothetical protein
MKSKIKIHTIYDNGGSTFDRYTVYFKGRGTIERNGLRMCIGMSEHPTHPQGFGQHTSGMIGKHNGKKITFDDLPVDCQQLVLSELNRGE